MALWFSRHTPTRVQLDEIRELGYSLIEDARATTWASFQLANENQVNEVVAFLRDYCGTYRFNAIFGVWAAPLQEVITVDAMLQVENAVSCFSAWNLTRTPEGGKPTFTHLKFCKVGELITYYP